MESQKKTDWVEDYGFILVSFAHMTDWKLLDCELEVIQKKMDFDSCECFRVNYSLTGFNIIFIWKTGIIV